MVSPPSPFPRSINMYGELLPLGGGDPIPLLKPTLMIGRRESADIVLRFPNVSGHHCELSLEGGCWTIKDLRSSNGTKVNGTQVTEQKLRPGDKLSIAKHDFEIVFDPIRLGGTAPVAEQSRQESLFSRSLLESAGLEVKPRGGAKPDRSRRHEL